MLSPPGQSFLGKIETAELHFHPERGIVLVLAGWLACTTSAPVLVRLGLDDLVLQAPLPRPDIARAVSCPQSHVFGFSGLVEVPRSYFNDRSFRVKAEVILENGQRHRGVLSLDLGSDPWQRVRDTGGFRDTVETVERGERRQAMVLAHTGGTHPLPPSAHPLLAVLHPGDADSLAVLTALRRVTEAAAPLIPQVIVAAAEQPTEDVSFEHCHSVAVADTLPPFAKLALLARESAAEYLVLLGTKTLPVSHTFAPALEQLQLEGNVAAICGPVIGADGFLLEAGCYVRGDGTIGAYGAGAERQRGDLCFSRPVDGGSAHLLLTRRSVFLQWAQESGASERTAAEYALWLTARGHEVRYEPSLVSLSSAARELPAEELRTVQIRRRRFEAYLADRPMPGSVSEVFFREAGRPHGRILLLLHEAPAAPEKQLVTSLIRHGIPLTVLRLDSMADAYDEFPPTVEQLRLNAAELRALLSARAGYHDTLLAVGATAGRVGLAIRPLLVAQKTPKLLLTLHRQESALLPLERASLSPSEVHAVELGVPLDEFRELLRQADVVLTADTGLAEELRALGARTEPPEVEAIERWRRWELFVQSAGAPGHALPQSHSRSFTEDAAAPGLSEFLRNFTPAPAAPLTEAAVDIVIPVYGALEALQRAVASVLTGSDLPYRLWIVDDASPGTEIRDYLEVLLRETPPSPCMGITVLTNARNVGFPGSVNRALAYTSGHVVILNSDTEVPARWLSRLIAPLEDRAIGSATPFSNSATICSFPRILDNTELWLGMPLARIDEYFAQLAPATPFTIPTGVGFCLALSKHALKQIGGFDEVLFGRGYGEENDWCLRAERAGFRNVLVPNLFVYHEGAASFGRGGAVSERQRLHLDRLHLLYPDYHDRVQRYIAEDPLQPLRTALQTLILPRISRRQKATLYLMNPRLKGGSSSYLEHLLRQREDEERQYLLTISEGQAALIDSAAGELVHHFSAKSFGRSEFLKMLELLQIEEIFVNQLAGLDRAHIFTLLRGCPVPYRYFVHDSLAVCPSLFLLNSEQRYCGAPTDVATCRRCLAKNSNVLSGIPGETGPLPDIADWRADFKVFIDGAQSIETPSVAATQMIRRYYPEAKAQSRPHSLRFGIAATYRKEFAYRRPLRVGIVGAIGAHKGAREVEQLAAMIRAARLGIELVVIGYTDTRRTGVFEDGVLRITGGYSAEEIALILARYEIGLVLIPTNGFETFSYVTLEALTAGYPVMCFNIGGPAEQVLRTGGGWLVQERTAAALFAQLSLLAQRPEDIVERAMLLGKRNGGAQDRSARAVPLRDFVSIP